MRYLNRPLLATAILGFASAPVFAQSGTIASGGGVTTGSLSGTGGMAGGGTGGISSGSATANPGSQANSLSTGLSSTSGITAPGATGGSASSVISASNFLSSYYGNPYYQGLLSNAPSNSGKGALPGGFGSPLFGTTGGRGGGQIGSASSVVGGTGGGGLGGAGRTGRGGTGSGDPGGILVQLPVQIMHPAIARFPAMPIATSTMQNDLAAMIARSSEISTPGSVTVSVEGGIVTLTGTVKDLDEAKTIAGMIGLKPGVHRVYNNLTFPK